jgi:hypothetical protein
VIVGPHACEQPARVVVVAHVDRRQVDPDTLGDVRDLERRQRPFEQADADHVACAPATRRRAPATACVDVAVGEAVDEEVESRARTELDEPQPAAGRRCMDERGQQGGCAVDLVGLRGAGREEAGERVAVLAAERDRVLAGASAGGAAGRDRRHVRRELVLGTREQEVMDRCEQERRPALLRRGAEHELEHVVVGGERCADLRPQR